MILVFCYFNLMILTHSRNRIFFPLQGFFNLLVYFKPKILCYAQKRKKASNEIEANRESICMRILSVFLKFVPSKNESANLAFPIPINRDGPDQNLSPTTHEDLESRTANRRTSSVDDDNEDDDYLTFNQSAASIWRSEPCISESCNDDSIGGSGKASNILRSSVP